jgi:hypothetical protein
LDADLDPNARSDGFKKNNKIIFEVSILFTKIYVQVFIDFYRIVVMYTWIWILIHNMDPDPTTQMNLVPCRTRPQHCLYPCRGYILKWSVVVNICKEQKKQKYRQPRQRFKRETAGK